MSPRPPTPGMPLEVVVAGPEEERGLVGWLNQGAEAGCEECPELPFSALNSPPLLAGLFPRSLWLQERHIYDVRCTSVALAFRAEGPSGPGKSKTDLQSLSRPARTSGGIYWSPRLCASSLKLWLVGHGGFADWQQWRSR